jgi:subtilisin family serine protease
MKTHWWLIVGVVFQNTLFTVFSQQKYWVYLSDKDGVTFNPYEYFDQKAIDRRLKHGVDLYDVTDYPLRQDYVSTITSLADSVCGYTRWFNAMACLLTHDQRLAIEHLPFVLSVEPMVSEVTYAHADELGKLHEGKKSLLVGQTQWMGGDLFVAQGLSGKGVRICIIDAGFPGVDKAQEFAHIRRESRVIKTWDFVSNQPNVYKNHSHGSTVMSCIGGISEDNIPIGLAPDAEFLLARTERIMVEGKSEEEDWLMAVEWADRNGADIINSSLGYTVSLYFKENMNGKTAIISRAATLAARKGILVVNAAGNEGGSAWKYVAAPGDADSVLTVGGINPWTGIHTTFSSFGPTADFRMKPNVTAFGHVMAYGSRQGMHETQGTSFASPLVAGFAACVMQLYPDKKNMEIFDLIQQSSSLYPYYDYAHGFGIPQASFFVDSTTIDSVYVNAKPVLFHSTRPTFDVQINQSTIEVVIKDEFFQVNDNVVTDYYNRFRGLWRESDFFHILDSFISDDSQIKVEPANYVFYHFEENNKRLSKYYAVQPMQKNVLSIPIRPNRNTTLRIHYKGYTYEMEVKVQSEMENNIENDGE